MMQEKEVYPTETAGTSVDSEGPSPSLVNSNSHKEDEHLTCMNRIVNKLELVLLVTGEYTINFGEEIKRLKSQNPNLVHKEAFAQASKNWVRFPPNQNKEDGEHSMAQERGKNAIIIPHAAEVHSINLAQSTILISN
ncbi:hypothetical protein SAY86_006408 [Trapa natans]|uniref:YABBY protein C-terminal domain-containing protein n=1 Tax=Trapa natans TaxID=22666 RepID=A0AAN7QWR3_TRANT|nr:hypothetical protein SAY86_006408 [Trapa natans]